MTVETSSALTLAAAKHGAAHFRGPMAQQIAQFLAVFPSPQTIALSQVAAALGALSGPIVAGMFSPDDSLSYWEIASLPEELRARCEYERQNAVSFFEGRAANLQLQPNHLIMVATGTGTLDVTWGDILEWVRTVAMCSVGSTPVWNNGRVWLAFGGADGASSVIPGPDFDGCSRDHG